MKTLFRLFRLLIMVIQLAGLMAFFTQYVAWNVYLSVILSVVLVMWLPLAATILGFIGAIKVWLWPWWLALLLFLPGLALSLMAIAGVGAASLLSVFLLRKRRPVTPTNQKDIIEGEVISSTVDDDKPTV